MKTERLPDGALRFTFRQSGINTFLLCPERARQEWFFDLQEEPSDAAILGTALHAVIEADLAFQISNQDEGHDYGNHVLDDLIDEGVRWVNNDEAQIRRMLGNMVTTWWSADLRGELSFAPTRLEHSFEFCFDRDPYGNELWLTGQIDCMVLSNDVDVYDWKSAASPYKRWEKQRWAVQPTVYTWAARQMFPEAEPTFEYVVFDKKINSCSIQRVPVERSQGHYDWLKHQLWGITELNPERPWPLNDQHALCSEKWCPFWSQCKGKFITE